MSISTTTKKEAVYNYLRKNRRYIPGPEIEAAGGLRRLRELRSEGKNIVSRKNPKTGAWEYRLQGK